MKDHVKNKESKYFKYYINNLCRLAVSQKWPKDGLSMVKNTSELDEYFIENYNEESNLLELIELNK